MATTEKSPKEPRKTSEDQNEQSTVDKLGEALAKTELQEDDSSLAATEQVAAQSARPLHVYKRPELLFLSKSPLVKPPDGLPPLKEWFGDWNEQVGSKKETESSGSATNARERRFRPRDAEEGEGQARPSFRSSLSQPSQMGNFRHQSLRTTERERDRDTERERQRDERDREGQERLRNLSDKYDRDRLAASSNSTLRGKERDPAPHLTSGSSARRSQEQNGASARRTDARDAGRKKAGETSDDWRRAPDTGRTLRDDKSDTARKDRDRPRSRVRDSSRSRRDPSPGRRDKEDRPRRTEDRDDDYRRDREDYFPRRDWDDAPRDRDRDDRYRERERFDRSSRDFDRDTDDDPRRWRDDGRRDERQATRRERDRGDRNWDRWEPSHDRERVDDRDGRSKRTGGRDRRPGALDDLKEKDERKEKEPAWMEIYVPSSPGAGILGGKGADGELDGIQAWKKGMKEREKKDKDIETPPEPRRKSTTPPEVRETAAPTGEPPLDEIQMFKLMMKKEAAKKESDTLEPETPQSIPGGQAQAVKDGSNTQASVPEAVPQPSDNPGTSATSNDGARLLSLLAQGSTSSDPAVLVQPPKATAPVESSSSDIPVAVSRLFPTPAVQASDRGAIDLSSPAVLPNQFNPPAGSRLLAFAARSAPTNVPTNKPTHPSDILMNPLTPSGMIPPKLGGMTPPPPGIGINALHQGPDAFNSLQSEPHLIVNPRATPSDRSGRSYSPFNHASRQVNAADEIHDGVRLSHVDPLGRPIIAPHPEHGVFGSNSDISSPYGEQGGSPNFPLSPNFEHGGNVAGGGSSVGRGSRFAKFFDAKNRESQANLGPRRTPVQPGLVPTPPLPGHNGVNQSVAEHRAMEDLFAMLQSSTQQQHRASPQLQQTNRIPSGGGLYGQGPIDIQALHHQQQFAQQNARLDSLYDSRLDDRNFVPDGLVPGLRPAPRPRSREPTGVLFNEQLDDPLHFNAQRIQQQRHLEQLYPGQAPPFNQPALGRGGITLQQAQLRELQMREAQIREAQLREVQLREAQLREAAALREAQIREAQLRNQQGPQQRLPPGLANLGARPPHDPAQYINSQLGTPGGLLQSLQQGGPAQQRFDGFGGSFNGPSVARGPVPGPHHQNSAFNQLNGLGPANELRNPIGLGGASLGGNPRGLGPGFPQQQHLQAQLALRQQQQQQQHIPPQVLQHSLAPPHVQHQQQNIHVGNTQGTADLMALLMGGQRE